MALDTVVLHMGQAAFSPSPIRARSTERLPSPPSPAQPSPIRLLHFHIVCHINSHAALPEVVIPPGLFFSVADTPAPPPPRGGAEAKKVCVPKTVPKLFGPVGQGGPRPQTPAPPPPPPGHLSNSLIPALDLLVRQQIAYWRDTPACTQSILVDAPMRVKKQGDRNCWYSGNWLMGIL